MFHSLLREQSLTCQHIGLGSITARGNIMNNINFTDIYLQTQAAGLAERNEQRRRQLEAIGADVPAPRRTVRMPQWFAGSLKVIRYHLPATS